jgi:hypothetical protein
MRQHVEHYMPLARAIIMALVFESKIARDDEVHELYQSRNGPGSFGLYLADGRQFHFRVGGPDAVAINDAYKEGRQVAVIKNEAQARSWVRKLNKG